LPPVGFAVFMAGVAVVSFAAGLAFFLIGAWPVLGFLGLDVLLIYVAFRASYRSARHSERVRLSENELLVERVSPHGAISRWTFQPYWVRVNIEAAPGGSNVLTIASHGRSLTIGDFLSPEERVDFAAALGNALAPLKGGQPG
jgi:uncharacterized membrane protein